MASATHHDIARGQANLTLTIPRSDFGPSPINPKKMMATKVIKDDHLTQITGVSHVDFLNTKEGKISHIEMVKADGLPTGAVLGIVAGTQKDGQFTPYKTDRNTSHHDENGDTNIYTATFSGRDGTPSHADHIEIVRRDDHEYSNPGVVAKKVERWQGFGPEDAKQGIMTFSGKSESGKVVNKTAVKKGSALDHMLEINKENKKFDVGKTRTIMHAENPGDTPEEYTIIDAPTAEKLSSGLEKALQPGMDGEKTFKIFADRGVIESGTCPISVTMNLHRKDIGSAIPRDAASGGLITSATISAASSGVSSLAHRVFEDEKTPVVSIEEGASGSD